MIKQLARYGGVGVIVYAIDLASFWLIATVAPALYLMANMVGKAMGAATGFVLHKRFTFAGQQRHRAGRQALLYVGLLGFNMALSSLLLWLATQAGAPMKPARIAIDIVIVATTFLAGRFLIFRSS